LSNEDEPDVLVIGAGIAGIEASLLLSKAGRKVHLVERTSYTGGNSIRCEEVFTGMECATCMLAPRQQELLQDPNIELLTLSEIEKVEELDRGYRVSVRKRAGFVDPLACIGCGACYDPCPVSAPNEFEMGLSQRKAIFIPVAGALPNTPVIDTGICLRFKGEDCQLCKEACVFEAIDYGQEDTILDIEVGAIMVATGFDTIDLGEVTSLNSIQGAYTAFEFERMFASNGPTEGEILLDNGQPPRSAAIIHCVGREQVGYCSAVCCLYSMKFSHYLRSKIPGIEILELHSDLCLPGKRDQGFCQRMTSGVEMVRVDSFDISEGDGILVMYVQNGKMKERSVDMVILAPAMVPADGSEDLANILQIETDQRGFFKETVWGRSSRDGIYIVGCAQGPMDQGSSVTQALAAVGDMISQETQERGSQRDD
jgi:heterodisulfide reductase subunit A